MHEALELPEKRCLRVKWYQAVRTAEEVYTLRERATILLYTYIAYLVVLIVGNVFMHTLYIMREVLTSSMYLCTSLFEKVKWI